ncbi:MAG: hypothetical protein ACFFAH_05680 [Promethearchaeota archaeon]
MYSNTQTFEVENKDLEIIQQEIKNLLQNTLDFNTMTESTISFFDKKTSIEELKKNKIVIRQDQKKLLIEVMGNLTEGQNNVLWQELNKIAKLFKSKPQIKISEKELINNIIKRIKAEGFNFKIEDAQKFIINFQRKFNRLPEINEIESIGYGYIMMLNQEMSADNIDYETVWKEKFSEDLEESLVETSSNKKGLLIKEKNDELLTENGYLEVSKPLGRRVCPKCGNQSVNSIRELEDKNFIISEFPKMYGKKYQCRMCNCEWKEI